MVLFLLVPLLLGGVAAAMAMSASELCSEDSSSSKDFSAILKKLDLDTRYNDYDFDYDDYDADYDEPYESSYDVKYSDLLDVLEHHTERIRRLERMLEGMV